jgi:ABC-type multidrug transport system fused ATPase/permease subunit
MYETIKNLFKLLRPAQRKRFYKLQILVIFMSVFEILGISSIVPFITLVADPSVLEQDNLVAKIYIASGIIDSNMFLVLLGCSVLILLFFASCFSMFTLWRLCMFANQLGAEISDELYSYYLKQSWLFHASSSSSQLTKKIANETMRVTTGILLPIMKMNQQGMLGFSLSLGLIIYDPIIASVGFCIFGIAYLILFKFVRSRLEQNGKKISQIFEQRFRLMNDGFGGIKDILLLGRDNDFIKRFSNSGKLLSYSQGTNQALSQTPRYLMELVAFGSIISLILFFIIINNSNLGALLSVLSLYAIATLKIVPAFQKVYANAATIRGNIAAFHSIQQDLINALNLDLSVNQITKNSIYPNNKISLEGISFRYPNKSLPAITNLNISIDANSVVGIVGSSGSGKSTLIDLILGLIEPQKGCLKVDNQIINQSNVRSWQNNIGFVSQSIFLSEGTIAENIAFGLSNNEIEISKVEKAIKLAHLDELVNSLEDGINTKVGERGVQLSGGQRQRIGIARALYNESEVLIFDEATSSLDGVTENLIMNAIYEFTGKKTIIIIAHRLKTIQGCDQIFFLNQGRVVDKGTYQDLIEKNEHFQQMALRS